MKFHNIGIIGGGLTGCVAALELADRGYTIALFEKKMPF
jgi:glycine/D-amino acid oxidase-like deaminating enzyme